MNQIIRALGCRHRGADLNQGAGGQFGADHNLVKGGRDTGAALVAGEIDGLLFTGSGAAGAHVRRMFADRPEVILALELGGNNPLIGWDGDPAAVASFVVASAFVSSG